MLQRLRSLLLVAVVNLVACGPGDNGSICPFCVPQAGGETSDFGGSSLPCFKGKTLPLTAELAQQYDVDAVRARVEGPFEAELRWTLTPYAVESLEGTDYARLPSGYEESTRVKGQVTLESPVFVDIESYEKGPAELPCRNWVELRAQVTLTTADGAVMAAPATGTLRIGGHNGLVPTLYAEVDLTEVQGRLDLHAKPDDNPRGNLWVTINAFPEGLRGELTPRLDRNFEVINGQWPSDDGCDEKAFPIDLDSPHPWLAGRSARDELMQWQTAIAGIKPAVGRWLDGTEVAVEVAFGDAPQQQACMGAVFDEPYIHMRGGQGRLTTSDGRVNAPLSYSSLSPSRFYLATSGPRLMPGEFEAHSGIHGVDAFGSPWLSASVSTTYVRTEKGVTLEGQLEVVGQPRCAKHDGPCEVDPREHGAGIDCLNWPPRDFWELCGRHLR